MTTNKYSDISDAELLYRFKQSDDSEWLGVLLQRYTLLLFGVSMKYLKNEDEAKDAVQQIFLKVIQEIKKYKVDYFKSWLYMIARNYCLTLLRNQKNKIPVPLQDEKYADAYETFKEDKYIEEENSLQLLPEALELLNDEQKICIKKFYLEKKSYQQIADETSFSLLKVKSYIQNGKRNMKLIIEKKLKQMKQ